MSSFFEGMAAKLKASQERIRARQAAGDYDPAMTFTIDKGQKRQIDEWLKNTVYPAAIEKQKALHESEGNPPDDVVAACWESGYPYLGAIGGGLTYEISPTSLGVVVIAKFDYVGMELNVTDYDCW